MALPVLYGLLETVVSWWPPYCNIFLLLQWINILFIVQAVVALVILVYHHFFWWLWNSWCYSRTCISLWEIVTGNTIISNDNLCGTRISLQIKGSTKEPHPPGLTASQLICCNKSIFSQLFSQYVVSCDWYNIKVVYIYLVDLFMLGCGSK